MDEEEEYVFLCRTDGRTQSRNSLKPIPLWQQHSTLRDQKGKQIPLIIHRHQPVQKTRILWVITERMERGRKGENTIGTVTFFREHEVMLLSVNFFVNISQHSSAIISASVWRTVYSCLCVWQWRILPITANSRSQEIRWRFSVMTSFLLLLFQILWQHTVH